MTRTAKVSPEKKLWPEFKRQSIQAAVIRLMCREGLKNVTMERVAEETGIAKGTIYLHYRDKKELLEAVKESALAPLRAKIDEVLQSDLAPDRKLAAYSIRYLAYFDENRDLFRVLLYDREVTRVKGARYRTDRYRYTVEAVSSVIERGQELGIFREISSRKAAAMFIEANIAIVNQRLQVDDNGPVEDDARTIVGLFLRGLAPDSDSRSHSQP